MTADGVAGAAGRPGLTLTFEGGDRHTAEMSDGTCFVVRQEAWSVKSDYYLDTLVYHLPDIVREIRASGNRLERILEMGIARGVLSIALALLTGDGTEIVGVDVEENARRLVAENAALNGVAGRIEVRIGDLFEPVDESERFDLVLAEMPFIPVDPVLQERYIQQGHASEILNVSGGPDGRHFVDIVATRGAGYVGEGGALLLVQPSFIGVDRTLELMAAEGIDGRVFLQREWLLEDTRFTLRSRGYIESLYPAAFPVNDAGKSVFYVTIILGVRRRAAS